jgi:hypothetical protein
VQQRFQLGSRLQQAPQVQALLRRALCRPAPSPKPQIARAEVPANGVETKALTEDEMKANLDAK